MGFMHQQLIEILSYAMVITVLCCPFLRYSDTPLKYYLTFKQNLLQKNHIYTSGASGTNAAVIRGALRAEKPELLTVILPQSLKKQPPESQELLAKVISPKLLKYLDSHVISILSINHTLKCLSYWLGIPWGILRACYV